MSLNGLVTRTNRTYRNQRLLKYFSQIELGSHIARKLNNNDVNKHWFVLRCLSCFLLKGVSRSGRVIVKKSHRQANVGHKVGIGFCAQ